MKPGKGIFIGILFISLISNSLLLSAEEEKTGVKAGKDISERVKTQETSSSDQELLVEEIAEFARKAGESHPDDPDAVKKAVKEKLDEIMERETKGQGKSRKPGGKSNKEIKEWAKKLKKELINEKVVSLPRLNETALLAVATGTGRTSGHIANLTVENKSGTPVHADIGPFFIPATDRYQPYLVPGIQTITAEPMSAVTVKLEGWCADIHRPPVPQGASMIPVGQWISPERIQNDWSPSVSAGWKNNPESILVFPGTDRPLPYSVDLTKNPGQAVPLLFEMADRIAEAYDHMKGEGRIRTPFSGNPEKERESVIQQTFWISAAALTGVAYKLDGFSGKTKEQFELNSGEKFRDLPKKEKDQLESGISDFWQTFQAVGVEAKILSAESLKKGSD